MVLFCIETVSDFDLKIINASTLKFQLLPFPIKIYSSFLSLLTLGLVLIKSLNCINTCSVALKEKFEKAAKANSLPKVLIVVHMAGQSARMEAMGKLAQQFGVAIIEDASHAIGGKYREEPVGCCKWSDITIFSFHPVKIITTA